MTSKVFVKIVGFRDVERHALNTVFRLSETRDLQYVLWTPEAPLPAQLALIDTESYEGGLAIASSMPGRDLKVICVGSAGLKATSSPSIMRPLDWTTVVKAMDQLFLRADRIDPDATIASYMPGTTTVAHRHALLVDSSRDNRLYLRARLALAGMTSVDDSADSGQALELSRTHRYSLVVVNVDDQHLDGWKLASQLVALEPALGAVVLTTHSDSLMIRQKAEQSGCQGVLNIPFDPTQIIEMLQKL